MENIDPKVANIVKALAYVENGGKPTAPKAGKTGELKSTFQYKPDTWDIYSTQVSGKKGLPLTPENEAAVTYAKVDNWLKEGRIPEQIYSMWNAGEQRPDAYKQNFKGVNKKYGVAYDTPKYVEKAMSYLKQFEGEGGDAGGAPQAMAVSQPANTGMMAQPKSVAMETRAPKSEGLITPQMKQARQV